MKKYKEFILLNEIDFNIIPTTYTIHLIPKIQTEYYNFISKKGFSYNVYFTQTKENNFQLNDNSYIFDYINNNDIIPTIFFSDANRKLNSEIFDLLTKRNEHLEVMGKIVYLILEYISKHPQYNVYSIGIVNKKKFNFYNYYRKYFKNFNLKIGESQNYIDSNGNNSKAYYLIKK